MRAAMREAAEGNMLDRAIGWFAPQIAQKRMQARMTMAVAGNYVGASRSRRSMKEWTPAGTDPDSILSSQWGRDDLVERSLDLERNSPIARGALNTQVTSVVGTGPRLSAQVDRDVLGWSEDQAQEFEARAEQEWRLFSESVECDHYRRHVFAEQVRQAFRSRLSVGDTLIVLPMRQRGRWPYRTKIQLVEGTRLCNQGYGPNTRTLVDGVEKNQWGEPVAYHVMKDHPHSMLADAKRSEWDRFQAFGQITGRRNVLHLSRIIRPGQTRGEPYLAPVMETLKQMTRYTEAELMAAVVAGMFTVFVTSEDRRENFDAFNTDTDDATGDEDYKLGNGAIIALRDGEKVETANPGRPNAGYDPFILSLSRWAGAALDLPYELLVKMFNSSYTASQAAFQEAWRGFTVSRKLMADEMCQPIYEVLLDEAVALGRLSAPGFRFADPLIKKAYCGSAWDWPARGQLREDIEIKAARERIDIGISTRRAEAARITGQDADAVHNRLVFEKRRRTEDGLELAPPAAVVAPPESDDPDGEQSDEAD